MTTTQTNQVCYSSPGVFNRAQHRGTELLTLQSSNDLSMISLTFPPHCTVSHLWYSSATNWTV